MLPFLLYIIGIGDYHHRYQLHSQGEKFEANVKVLQQLGEHIKHCDLLLICLLNTRLDPTIRQDWEEFSTAKPAVTFEE